MTRTGRPHAAVAALAALVTLLVAGTLTAPGATAAGRSGDPDYQRPVVGECHDYSVGVVSHDSDGRPPTSCDASHTALTIAVLSIPRRVDLSAAPEKLYPVFARTCWRAFDRSLGGSEVTRAQTAYRWVWFKPTRSQLSAGARWVRCDLVQFAGPHAIQPIGTLPVTHLDRSDRRCLVDVGKQYFFTTCNRRHDHRSEGVIRLAAHGPYPSRSAFVALAERRCPAIAGRGWLALPPGPDEWRWNPDHTMVCYSRR